ncbi:phosphopantetheine-binding protein [Streptomyces sp. NPDC041068]|uniref:phosphopantetheine-binding protein n=1 Tax=Streptomyces sp. NPDC041068 TaxID=3155130 RepID=UPI0033E17C00
MDERYTDILRPFLPYLADRPITEDTPLRESGLTSMQSIELLLALEDGLDVELPDEALVEETFSTAGSLWSALAAVRGGADV